jgi:hypothetical protein
MAEVNESWGTYHISSNIANYELARSNYFTFIVENLGTLVRSDFGLVDPTEQDVITNGQEVIKLSVSKASVPHFSIAPIEMRRGNSVVKYAGNPTFDAGTLECQDFVGIDTKSTLMAWQALAYDVVNDKGGRAINYKKNCTLVEYDQAGNEIRHWDLIGCWISNITEDEFDVSADGDRKISCELQFDRSIMHLPD